MASFYVPLPPLDDDADQCLFPDLATADATTPDRPVSPVNTQDLVDLDAIPIMSNHRNNSTSWGVDAEQSEKLLNMYREAKEPAQRALMIRKRIARCRHEIIDLKEKTHYPESEDEDEDVDMWTEQNRRDRDTQIRKLEQELEQKQYQDERLEAELLSEEELLRKSAENCAVILSQPFTACVLAAFPAELCNIIFNYLWDEKYVDFIDGHIASPHHGKAEWRLSKPWVIHAPFFADARLVDPQFALEASIYFFRSISTAEVHYRFVRAFCEMSTFGNMSFRPINVIRRLTIDVAWLIYQWRDFAYTEFRENMEHLLTLPVKDDFEIVIYLPWCMQFSRLLFHVLETLRPVYKALVEENMKIKVLGYKFFVEDEEETETAEQLNYYFDTTPEKWLASKKLEINALPQGHRKVECISILEQMRNNFEDLGELEEHENGIRIAS